MQENTARQSESAAEAKIKENEAAVTRLSALLQRVCQDEPKFDVQLSALVDAMGAVVVAYSHNKEGVLILDDVIGIRDHIRPHLAHAVTRHTLERIGKDHTTVGSCCGDDELKDLVDALGGAKHDHQESVRAAVHPIPAGLAAALASLLGHREG